MFGTNVSVVVSNLEVGINPEEIISNVVFSADFNVDNPIDTEDTLECVAV